MSEDFKTGDEVVCVDADTLGMTLTLDKTYKVIAADSQHVMVEGDHGRARPYFKHRFNKKTAEKPRRFITAWDNGERSTPTGDTFATKEDAVKGANKLLKEIGEDGDKLVIFVAVSVVTCALVTSMEPA